MTKAERDEMRMSLAMALFEAVVASPTGSEFAVYNNASGFVTVRKLSEAAAKAAGFTEDVKIATPKTCPCGILRSACEYHSSV